MTNMTLADRYALIDAEIKALEKAKDAIKAEIKATGRELIEGDKFDVVVGLSERSALDQAKVKALLTPAQIAACTKTTMIETLRVKAHAKHIVLA